LSQIAVRDLDRRLIEKIEKKYGDQVIHALKTVSFKQEIYKAMLFVFGSFYICNNSQVAQSLIKEDPSIQCVTLEGDVFKSSGVVSGGYMGNFSRNIELTQEFKKRSGEINNINIQLAQLSQQLEECLKKLDHFKTFENQIIEKEIELKGLVLDSTQQKKSISNM